MSRSFVFYTLSVIFFCMAIPMPFDFDYAILVLFLCLDSYLIFVKKQTPNKSYLWWSLIFILFCSASLLWTIQYRVSLFQVGVRMTSNFLLGLFLTSYCKNYQRLSTVILAFYVSSVFYFVYIASMVDFSMLDDARITQAIENDEVAKNLNSNYIAGRLVFAFYAGYLLLWRLRKTDQTAKLFHVFFSIFIFYFLLMSGSRTVLGVLLLPPLVYVLNKTKHLLPALIFISVGVVLVYVVVMKIPTFYGILGYRIEEAFNVASGDTTGNEDVSRLLLVTYGLERFAENPIIGYGINSYKVLADNAMLFKAGGRYAHNNYVELMVDVGLIGLFIYYYAYVYFYKSIKYLRKVSVTIILKILLIVLLFTDFFWVGYYNRLSQILVWMAFIVVYIEKSKLKIDKSLLCNEKS